MEGPSLVGGTSMAAPGTAATAQQERSGSGVACSTSGTVLSDRDQLMAHYTSDFHRYNLKRKVAGLPPVTREWFEARKAQLTAVAPSAAAPLLATVWWDPLTRKAFKTEQTYLAHTRSNKFLEAVKKSGQPAPAPVVGVRKQVPTEEQQQQQQQPENKAAPRGSQTQATPGFTVKPPSGGLPLKAQEGDAAATSSQPAAQAEEEEGDAGSGWETASEEDLDQMPEEEEEWEEWDLCRSLFDNHISNSLEANLEYMWKKFGFYFPDAQYLKDPEGLLKYLGSKLQQGRVALYARGDDASAKQFRSLHAVQRHMIDSGRTKMLYDDNEDEYSEFYDYADEDEVAVTDAEGKELVLGADAHAPAVVATYGYELMVPGSAPGGGGGKVLGSREFARYYRQQHKPSDDRQIVMVNTMLSKYRALGIALRDEASSLEAKKLKTKTKVDFKWEGKRREGLFMRGNINRNLPKNVPY